LFDLGQFAAGVLLRSRVGGDAMVFGEAITRLASRSIVSTVAPAPMRVATARVTSASVNVERSLVRSRRSRSAIHSSGSTSVPTPRRCRARRARRSRASMRRRSRPDVDRRTRRSDRRRARAPTRCGGFEFPVGVESGRSDLHLRLVPARREHRLLAALGVFGVPVESSHASISAERFENRSRMCCGIPAISGRVVRASTRRRTIR
jgi:hypothetical protein